MTSLLLIIICIIGFHLGYINPMTKNNPYVWLPALFVAGWWFGSLIAPLLPWTT